MAAVGLRPKPFFRNDAKFSRHAINGVKWFKGIFLTPVGLQMSVVHFIPVPGAKQLDGRHRCAAVWSNKIAGHAPGLKWRLQQIDERIYNIARLDSAELYIRNGKLCCRINDGWFKVLIRHNSSQSNVDEVRIGLRSMKVTRHFLCHRLA